MVKNLYEPNSNLADVFFVNNEQEESHKVVVFEFFNQTICFKYLNIFPENKYLCIDAFQFDKLPFDI